MVDQVMQEDDFNIYDDEYREEGYWTRRQIVLTVIVLLMVIALLTMMAAPILRDLFQPSPPAPPPTHAPQETVQLAWQDTWSPSAMF